MNGGKTGKPAAVPLPTGTARLYTALASKSGALIHPVYPMLKLIRWHEGWALDPPKSDASSPRVKAVAFEDGRRALTDPLRRAVAERVRARRMAWLAPLERAGQARRLMLTARSDAVVWLVSRGPLGLGLAVHHVYGFPILPASSLKGLAHAHAAGDPDDLYGAQDAAGLVAFLDGLPLEGWEMQRDVMTPHFSKWYQGKRDVFPDDTGNPEPIPFLSIAAGSRFETWLVVRARAGTTSLDAAAGDLTRGLDETGLGAKTAAGYGVFGVTTEAAPPPAAPVAPPLRPVQPAAPAGFSARMAELQALRPGAAGQIAEFVKWCLELPEGPARVEVARLIIRNLGEKDARRRARGNADLTRVLEIVAQRETDA